MSDLNNIPGVLLVSNVLSMKVMSARTVVLLGIALGCVRVLRHSYII